MVQSAGIPLLCAAILAQTASPQKSPTTANPAPRSGAPNVPCPPTGTGGALNFANRGAQSGIDAKVFEPGGVTPLAGSNYLAQLYGAPCDRESSFVAIDKPKPFRTGVAAGYVTATSVTLPHVGPRQPVYVQMRCWEASSPTYEHAEAHGAALGKSAVIRVVTGGQTPGGFAVVPTDLIGLKSFSLIPAKPK